MRRRANALRDSVDAVNVTDSNRAVVAMAALPAAVIVRDAGLDPIVQVTGRDRNRIALQADLLGAAALGIEHFLFMSGDDPKAGNHPDAVNVKDLDGIGLVRMATKMRDEAKFLSGDDIKQAPQYLIGTAARLVAGDLRMHRARVHHRPTGLRARGIVHFRDQGEGLVRCRSQPRVERPPFRHQLRRLAKRKVAILAGVLVLRSAEQAERLAKVPGVSLGSAAERLKKADDQEEEGVHLAIETVRSLRALPGVAGVHLYAIEWPEGVTRVVAGAGLLPRPRVKESKTA